jgi:hypothetical protein
MRFAHLSRTPIALLVAAVLSVCAVTLSRSAKVALAAASSPSVTVTPGYLWFGNVSVNKISAYQTETVTNTGSSALQIASITLTPDLFNAFGIRNQTCGATLASGAACTFDIVFRPTAAGYAQSQISRTDSASGSPQQMYVAGEGWVGPLFVTDPGSLTFNPTPVGSTAGYQEVALQNLGAGQVTIKSIAITNTTDFYSWGIRKQTCGKTIAPNSGCIFDVAFRPTRTGAITASISVDYNSSEVQIQLAGTGK